jgi:hypothetical protein
MALHRLARNPAAPRDGGRRHDGSDADQQRLTERLITEPQVLGLPTLPLRRLRLGDEHRSVNGPTVRATKITRMVPSGALAL